MMAAQYGSVTVMLLLERRADTRLTNTQGLTAAEFARTVGRATLAERLSTLPR
jgi:hypothetical protein